MLLSFAEFKNKVSYGITVVTHCLLLLLSLLLLLLLLSIFTFEFNGIFVNELLLFVSLDVEEEDVVAEQVSDSSSIFLEESGFRDSSMAFWISFSKLICLFDWLVNKKKLIYNNKII